MNVHTPYNWRAILLSIEIPPVIKRIANTASYLSPLPGAIDLFCTYDHTHLWYKSPTSSTQHMCHTHVYFQGTHVFLCAWVYMCVVWLYTCVNLYIPCPHTVIHTRVYYYKMVAYEDRPSYVCIEILISHLSAKNHQFVLYLLHHNSITVHDNTTKSFSLLQNLMAFLLQFTEMEYYTRNWRY